MGAPNCSHIDTLWREANRGIPLKGLYCLDCGARVKTLNGKFVMLGGFIDPDVLDQIRVALRMKPLHDPELRIPPTPQEPLDPPDIPPEAA